MQEKQRAFLVRTAYWAVWAVLLWLGACGCCIASGWMAGGFSWRYYPTVKGGPLTPFTAGVQLAYLALCLTPAVFNKLADRRWARTARGGPSCSKV